MSLPICIYVCLCLSLSIYIYTYIYIYMHSCELQHAGGRLPAGRFMPVLPPLLARAGVETRVCSFLR